jgi:hypothetical protein
MRCRSVPFGYEQAPDAIEYAKFFSRSHDAVIRVFDAAGNVIENAGAQGRFQRMVNRLAILQPFKGHTDE